MKRETGKQQIENQGKQGKQFPCFPLVFVFPSQHQNCSKADNKTDFNLIFSFLRGSFYLWAKIQTETDPWETTARMSRFWTSPIVEAKSPRLSKIAQKVDLTLFIK